MRSPEQIAETIAQHLAEKLWPKERVTEIGRPPENPMARQRKINGIRELIAKPFATALAAKDAEIIARDEKLVAKDFEIEALTRAIRDREAEIERLKAMAQWDLTVANGEHGDLRKQLKAKDAEIQRLNEYRERDRAKRRKMADERNEYRSSIFHLREQLKSQTELLRELSAKANELCNAMVGQGTAGAIDGERVDKAHADLQDALSKPGVVAFLASGQKEEV